MYMYTRTLHTKPLHHFLDASDESILLLLRVGVIVAQVGDSSMILDSEVWVWSWVQVRRHACTCMCMYKVCVHTCAFVYVCV